jgi:hypothetical protein
MVLQVTCSRVVLNVEKTFRIDFFAPSVFLEERLNKKFKYLFQVSQGTPR